MATSTAVSSIATDPPATIAELLHRLGDLPAERVRFHPIPDLVPDLAVEVLSKSNSKAEIDRKLRESFEAGVRLVAPEARTLLVHTGPTAEESTLLQVGDSVDGGDVLPGFAAAVAELFPSEEV